jgi:ribosomal subunit interface protein
MKIQPQVSFHDIAPSDAMRAAVAARVAELEQFCADITHCRVAIESPHRHHRKGRHFRVRIDLTVPDEQIVVGRNPSEHGAHEDVYVAIRDAFDAARRQLQDFVRRRRGQVKERVGPAHAVVLRKGPDFGFLVDGDGREIYFHRNSVVGDFDDLVGGDEVRFAEEMGDQGPQATSVVPVGKSGHAAAPIGREPA